jgi:hypothetical protein
MKEYVVKKRFDPYLFLPYFISMKRHWKLPIVRFLLLLVLALLLTQCEGNDQTLRVYPSDVKSNLRLLFSACKAYWADEGSQIPCTLAIAKSKHYGYNQSSQVEIMVEQFLEKDFFAKAKHKKMGVYYIIDSKGIITLK